MKIHKMSIKYPESNVKNPAVRSQLGPRPPIPNAMGKS
jgi:hypothetical protein